MYHQHASISPVWPPPPRRRSKARLTKSTLFAEADVSSTTARPALVSGVADFISPPPPSSLMASILARRRDMVWAPMIRVIFVILFVTGDACLRWR